MIRPSRLVFFPLTVAVGSGWMIDHHHHLECEVIGTPIVDFRHGQAVWELSCSPPDRYMPYSF